MNEGTYILRLPATDWDKEAAKAINDYLEGVEPDADGVRPKAYVDEKSTKWLGVHVFPLDGYTDEERQGIAVICTRILNRLAPRQTDTTIRPFSRPRD
jgi:hypothetical protein